MMLFFKLLRPGGRKRGVEYDRRKRIGMMSAVTSYATMSQHDPALSNLRHHHHEV
jgi:hypothetical protein